MRNAMLALLLAVNAMPTFGDTTCEVTASEKKLSGAAKNSFMQKCSREQACDVKAAEKKLHGAAKSSYLKKCIADAKAASK